MTTQFNTEDHPSQTKDAGSATDATAVATLATRAVAFARGLTNAAIIGIAAVVLGVLSIIGWAYGVIQNRSISGMPSLSRKDV